MKNSRFTFVTGCRSGFKNQAAVRVSHPAGLETGDTAGLETGATRKTIGNRQSAIPLAFTLIELLVVISIMGLIAALGVPAFKNLGKSNTRTNAQRQLLDDLGRARQLAISQHTTVYMVFVPTNYFNLLNVNGGNTLQNDVLNGTKWTINPTSAEIQQGAATMSNLVESQLSGYNFISYGQVGDQPGQHAWHYLASWQTLPQGMMIDPAKFLPRNDPTWLNVPQWTGQTWSDYPNAGQIDNWLPVGGSYKQQIYGFTNYASGFPFPTEKAPSVMLPCLAFDSTGRLVSEFDGVNYHHAYIPLAQGSVAYGYDGNKRPVLSPVLPGGITEVPPGNSSSISYNIIDVDPLSGRAKLMVHHIPQ